MRELAFNATAGKGSVEPVSWIGNIIAAHEERDSAQDSVDGMCVTIGVAYCMLINRTP
jgi:hypothetical protein